MLNDPGHNFDAVSGPRVDAAFFCESFSQEPNGLMTFHRIVQAMPAVRLPAKFERLALGILVSGLPPDRITQLDFMLAAPNAIVEIGGNTRMTVEIPAKRYGLAQLAYNIKDLLLLDYGFYRVEFFFDGSTVAAHAARFLLFQEQPAKNNVRSHERTQ